MQIIANLDDSFHLGFTVQQELQMNLKNPNVTKYHNNRLQVKNNTTSGVVTTTEGFNCL